MSSRRNYFKQRQQKKYQSRKYKNPFFQHAAKKKLLERLFLWLLLPASLLTGIVLLFVHPSFALARVEVRGIEYIDASALEGVVTEYLNESVIFIFDKQNRFLFSTEELEVPLMESFALSDVTISTQEDTLFITVEERTSNLIWVSNNTLYVTDLTGVVVRELPEQQAQVVLADADSLKPDVITQDVRHLRELPIFNDLNDIEVSIGSTVLTPEEVDHVMAFEGGLDTLGIKITHIDVDRLAGKWMRAVTVGGYGILFDASSDVSLQLANLEIVLRDQIEDPSSLEYIDLRFGDRVYFK